MNALVLYESRFGNTERVAEAIALALQEAVPTRLATVEEVTDCAEALHDVDLLVVGANDVVNPDARNNRSSPIYGMPILNVDDAQAVVVLKRSMNPGFAGIENPLFYNPKTVMLFGDAKASITKLIQDVKTL